MTMLEAACDGGNGSSPELVGRALTGAPAGVMT